MVSAVGSNHSRGEGIGSSQMLLQREEDFITPDWKPAKASHWAAKRNLSLGEGVKSSVIVWGLWNWAHIQRKMWFDNQAWDGKIHKMYLHNASHWKLSCQAFKTPTICLRWEDSVIKALRTYQEVHLRCSGRNKPFSQWVNTHKLTWCVFWGHFKKCTTNWVV